MDNEQAAPGGAKLRQFETSANVWPYHQQLGRWGIFGLERIKMVFDIDDDNFEGLFSTRRNRYLRVIRPSPLGIASFVQIHQHMIFLISADLCSYIADSQNFITTLPPVPK